MKTAFQKKLSTRYPEWHFFPLRLSLREMKKPKTVIKFFFDAYTLPLIRACLQEWLEDALREPGGQIKEHYYTHHDIERLVESVFLIHGNTRKKIKRSKKH